MNLNPLFWVNELKEMGEGMKAAGPITTLFDVLFSLTQSNGSAHFVFILCFSLIIVLGVRVRTANCADFENGSDSPKKLTLSLAVLSHLALCQLIQFFDFFFGFLSLFKLSNLCLLLWGVISERFWLLTLLGRLDCCCRSAGVANRSILLTRGELCTVYCITNPYLEQKILY